MVGAALKTELDVAVHAEIVGTGEVSSTGEASRTGGSTSYTVIDGTVSGTGVGGVIICVENIDAADATSGVGAIDAVGWADHTLTSGWRDGELCSIAGLTGIVGIADQTVRIEAGEAIAVKECDS